MVQQQFIIAELTDESEHAPDQESVLQHQHLEEAQEDLGVPKDLPSESPTSKKPDQYSPEAYSRGFGVNKVSFAIFASFIMDDTSDYKKYVSASQSSFRIMGMVIPDSSVILETLL